jgi:hypothetical protein
MCMALWFPSFENFCIPIFCHLCCYWLWFIAASSSSTSRYPLTHHKNIITHVSKNLNMSCRCPITCRYPMTRYTNVSHLFSKIVVFVRLEQASTLETCTIFTPLLLCFNYYNFTYNCTINMLFISLFYLFLKLPLWECIVQKRVT